MIEGAIAAAIKADATLSGQLAAYSDGRAIFTRDMPPKDCKYPAIVIMPIAGQSWGTRSQLGGDVFVDVTLFYDRDNQIEKAIRKLARDLWKFLDKGEFPALADAGFENCGIYADPPIHHEDDNGFPGYTIRVRGVVLNT